jgi:Mg-chelatase subunit ChlI
MIASVTAWNERAVVVVVGAAVDAAVVSGMTEVVAADSFEEQAASTARERTRVVAVRIFTDRTVPSGRSVARGSDL